MRESESREQESEEARRARLEKKRMIRKSKAQSCLAALGELQKIDTSSLSREEKARLQKVKNREAAQKSRDSHRQYVLGLEREVRQLREELAASRRICWKCQRELEEASTHESSSSEQQTEERSKAEGLFSFEGEEPREHCFQHLQEESFLREESSDFSYCKLMLFVCMLAVAVLLATNQPHPAPSRALMQIPDNNQQHNNLSAQAANTTAVVPVEQGLIALNRDCLDSLMAVEGEGKGAGAGAEKRSLRTYHEPSQNYLASQEGILLCSVRIPKGLGVGVGKLRSPLVRLFLLGSQIKEMVSQSRLLLPIRDSSVQVNGLYRVSAEVKDVSLVTDRHCLL